MLSFSIVTPSLNQGAFVERAIRSVLDQVYAPLEYVVCDGGSTDDTVSILLEFSDRVRLVSEPDRGQAEAVNKGIGLSSGEVIGWLNSDDVFVPGALKTVAELLGSRPDVDVVYGDAQLINADDHVLGKYYTEPWRPERLAERCFLCQPAVFFRRGVVERFGALDDRLQYCMDYEYWLRLADGGAAFAYLPQVLAASRLHPDTKTLGSRLAVHREINTMLRERLGRVPDSWLINHAHTLVELRRSVAQARQAVLPYSLEVVVQSMRLSWQWNQRLSLSLLTSAVQPVLGGARRRASGSPSTARSGPARGP